MNFDVSSKLLEKMWDTVVDKGISALLRPWQMKRENKARLECIRQDKLETLKIESEAKQLQLSLDRDHAIDAEIIPQIKQIASEVVSQKVNEILQQEVSVAKAVAYAGEYVEGKNLDDEKPNETPSQDWLNKWKKRTSEFTDEDALKLWGRVLAGEFASPGKFSYKFLDWLNGITMTDAQLIMKLAENVIGDIYFREKNENETLSYDNLLELEELGVLQGVDALGLSVEYSSRDQNSYVNHLSNKTKILLIEHPDSTKKMKLNNVSSLTRIGKEVMQLCDVETNPDMIQKLGEHIIKQGFEVSCADIYSRENGLIRYRNIRKIELPKPSANGV